MAQISHSNLYCRNFPPSFTDGELVQLFSPFGDLVSVRLVGATEGQAPHAFVKYELPAQAGCAIQALNGTTVSGSQLVVKFADADVQPRVESGRQPSEWSYCRNLPAAYTRQDVGDMFLPFGTVLEIRLFPSTELYKGSGALVQMQSIEQAAVAIQTLNGSFPRGATQPLLVRYADSPAEKAAKQARKERLIHKQAASVGLFGNGSLLAAQLQQQLLGLAITGGSRSAMPASTSMGNSPELSADLPAMLSPLDYNDSTGSTGLPSAAMLQQQVAAMAAGANGSGGAGASGGGAGASIYIKGMPEDADKLWLYEKFARFGGISSVRVLIDEQSGKCNGIGFVNYASGDAARLAQESMNGISMGDRLLHVMVQNPATRTRPSHTGPGGGLNGVMNGGMNGGGGPQPGMGGGSVRSSQVAAHMHAVNQLGLNASALASLHAGLMPPGGNGGISMQPMPAGLQMSNDGGHQQGYGHHHAMGQHPGSFNSLQW